MRRLHTQMHLVEFLFFFFKLQADELYFSHTPARNYATVD